jgi:DNA repair exonuclease SbcCD ATPase subunit
MQDNIETRAYYAALDQIKQHIDTKISSLSQDIKDLRGFVINNNRTSMTIVAQPFDESASPSTRPTDKQFQKAAGRLSKIWGESGPSLKSEPSLPETTHNLLPQATGQSVQAQMTGSSTAMSDVSNRIVDDLRIQFDEVQNLRRDLGVMRQLYTEFMNQTKGSLTTLRGQAHSVRQLAVGKIAGARAYIQDGKSKLDTRSQNVLTKMEELQDTVEGVKDDVIKRQISPKPHVLKAIQDDIKSLTKELESLQEHIQTVKPMWKKTWEEELQLIVEEQQFLSHQEEFLNDLQDDHNAVLEIYGHVEKVISLRGTGSRSGRGRGFGLKPAPVDDGAPVISTVMAEIRGAAVDQDRRMKAIAANEKTRERELASKPDEFHSELNGFVTNKKLKMTGGAEEVERVRQKRNDQTLKAMFSAPTVGPSQLPPLPSSPVIGPDSTNI